MPGDIQIHEAGTGDVLTVEGDVAFDEDCCCGGVCTTKSDDFDITATRTTPGARWSFPSGSWSLVRWDPTDPSLPVDASLNTQDSGAVAIYTPTSPAMGASRPTRVTAKVWTSGTTGDAVGVLLGYAGPSSYLWAKIQTGPAPAYSIGYGSTVLASWTLHELPASEQRLLTSVTLEWLPNGQVCGTFFPAVGQPRLLNAQLASPPAGHGGVFVETWTPSAEGDARFDDFAVTYASDDITWCADNCGCNKCPTLQVTLRDFQYWDYAPGTRLDLAFLNGVYTLHLAYPDAASWVDGSPLGAAGYDTYWWSNGTTNIVVYRCLPPLAGGLVGATIVVYVDRGAAFPPFVAFRNTNNWQIVEGGLSEDPCGGCVDCVFTAFANLGRRQDVPPLPPPCAEEPVDFVNGPLGHADISADCAQPVPPDVSSSSQSMSPSSQSTMSTASTASSSSASTLSSSTLSSLSSGQMSSQSTVSSQSMSSLSTQSTLSSVSTLSSSTLSSLSSQSSPSSESTQSSQSTLSSSSTASTVSSLSTLSSSTASSLSTLSSSTLSSSTLSSESSSSSVSGSSLSSLSTLSSSTASTLSSQSSLSTLSSSTLSSASTLSSSTASSASTLSSSTASSLSSLSSSTASSLSSLSSSTASSVSSLSTESTASSVSSSTASTLSSLSSSSSVSGSSLSSLSSSTASSVSSLSTLSSSTASTASSLSTLSSSTASSLSTLSSSTLSSASSLSTLSSSTASSLSTLSSSTESLADESSQSSLSTLSSSTASTPSTESSLSTQSSLSTLSSSTLSSLSSSTQTSLSSLSTLSSSTMSSISQQEAEAFLLNDAVALSWTRILGGGMDEDLALSDAVAFSPNYNLASEADEDFTLADAVALSATLLRDADADEGLTLSDTVAFTVVEEQSSMSSLSSSLSSQSTLSSSTASSLSTLSSSTASSLSTLSSSTASSVSTASSLSTLSSSTLSTLSSQSTLSSLSSSTASSLSSSTLSSLSSQSSLSTLSSSTQSLIEESSQSSLSTLSSSTLSSLSTLSSSTESAWPGFSGLGTLTHWWTATDEASIELDVGGGVLAWTDQVAVQAMSQATESQQPAYDSTGLNGFGALLFDSSASQWLGVDSKLFSGTSGAIIAVVEEVGGGSANSTIIGQGRNNQDNWMSFESEGGTANTPALDSDDGTQNGDVSYTANTACVLVVRSDGSLYKFWRDGTAGSTIGNGNWWDDAASNANQTTIGARRRNGTTDRFFEGYIAEILVYSSITDANILRAINALRSTYGI